MHEFHFKRIRYAARLRGQGGTNTVKLVAEAQYTIMKRTGQYLCAATQTGSIHILDSGTLAVVKIFEGHTGI